MSLILDLLFPPTNLNSSELLSQGIIPLENSPLEAILCLYHYRPPLSDYLQEFKYRFVSTYAQNLANLAITEIRFRYKNLLSYWQREHFCLIPVPLHPSRQNWRGYNQADLLAKYLAISLNLPYLPDLLLKTSYRRPQAQTSKQERLTNLQEAYSVNPNKPLSIPANFLIVDDVTTTHTTLKEAAMALASYSDKKIWGLTLAG